MSSSSEASRSPLKSSPIAICLAIRYITFRDRRPRLLSVDLSSATRLQCRASYYFSPELAKRDFQELVRGEILEQLSSDKAKLLLVLSGLTSIFALSFGSVKPMTFRVLTDVGE